MEIIVSKNCGPTMFFRDLLECLLVDRRDGTGRYISGLCFPMVPADTGRPPREPEGGGGGVDELGRQEGGMRLPAGYFAESARRWKEEMKENTHISITRCSQKLDELEKNGNCSYPVGEEVVQHGARQADPAGKNGNIA